VAGNIIEARPFASIRSTARRQIDSKALARSILQLSKGQATTREIKFDDCSLRALTPSTFAQTALIALPFGRAAKFD